jgi:hypothetical protein
MVFHPEASRTSQSVKNRLTQQEEQNDSWSSNPRHAFRQSRKKAVNQRAG